MTDGQQIVVGLPRRGARRCRPRGRDHRAEWRARPGRPEHRDLEQLQTLPGVGPVLAQHILDWRSAHGRFTSVDQLNDVSGIGDVKYAALRPLVTV